METDPVTYELTWRAKFITTASLGIESLDDLIERVEVALIDLKDMRDAGVRMAEHSAPADDHIFLTTDDPKVAETFGFSEVETGEDEE